MAKKKQGTRRSVDDIVGALAWSECESGAITLHDDNPRADAVSLTGDDVRVLSAEIARLRADLARLTQERDEARRGYGELRGRLEERSRELATAMGQNERYRRALSAAKADIGIVAITGSRAKAETARARIDAALAPEQEAT